MANNIMGQLDATIEALNGDLTGIAMDRAQDVIGQWQQTLQETEKPDLLVIANSLGDLKDCLLAEPLKGRDIGAALQQLGQQVGAASHSVEVDPDTSAKLQQLSQALSRAGNALGY